MSDLSKITILQVIDNYCEVKIEQYVNNEDSCLNENVRDNENLRSATLFAYLLDVADYFSRYKNKKIPLSEEGEAYYSEEKTKKYISKTEILDWKVGPPDLNDPETKAKYDAALEFDTEETVLSDLRQMNFTARIYVNDKNLLTGFESGMLRDTSLDTYICDWL